MDDLIDTIELLLERILGASSVKPENYVRHSLPSRHRMNNVTVTVCQ